MTSLPKINVSYLGTQRSDALQVPPGHAEDVDIGGQYSAELAVCATVASAKLFRFLLIFFIY